MFDALPETIPQKTYLNGQAVPVILTARINFSLGNIPQ